MEFSENVTIVHCRRGEFIYAVGGVLHAVSLINRSFDTPIDVILHSFCKESVACKQQNTHSSCTRIPLHRAPERLYLCC